MWKCFLVARRDYKHQKHASDSKITYLVFKVILTKKVLISYFSVWHELNFSTQGKIEIFDTDIYIFLCFLIISIVSYVKLFKLLFILQDSYSFFKTAQRFSAAFSLPKECCFLSTFWCSSVQVLTFNLCLLTLPTRLSSSRARTKYFFNKLMSRPSHAFSIMI